MSNKKPIVLTRAVEQKIYEKFLILTLAYFMELGAFAETDEEERPIYDINEDGEKRYRTDPSKLETAYSSLASWLNAVKDHMISINQVKRIIEERLNERLE